MYLYTNIGNKYERLEDMEEWELEIYRRDEEHRREEWEKDHREDKVQSKE